MAAAMRVAAGLPDQGLYRRVAAGVGAHRGSLEQQCVPSGRANQMCSSIHIFLVSDTRGPFRVVSAGRARLLSVAAVGVSRSR